MDLRPLFFDDEDEDDRADAARDGVRRLAVINFDLDFGFDFDREVELRLPPLEREDDDLLTDDDRLPDLPDLPADLRPDLRDAMTRLLCCASHPPTVEVSEVEPVMTTLKTAGPRSLSPLPARFNEGWP